MCRTCSKRPCALSGRRATCRVCHAQFRYARAQAARIEAAFRRVQAQRRALRRAA